MQENNSPFTIGFDAKRAAQNGTGLGNYSRFVIKSIHTNHPEWRINLYIPNIRKAKYLNSLVQEKNISIHFPLNFLEKTFRSLWRSFGITTSLNSDHVSLYHGLSNELPLNIRRATNCKTILTMHDLIFLRCPNNYGFIDRHIYNFKAKKACKDANRIIAVSECTKRDIIDFYHTNSDKISVVYQGCDNLFRTKCTEQQKQDVHTKYGLPDKFLLYVGTIEERKNLLLIAKALPYLPKNIDIVAIGRQTPYADKIKKQLQKSELTQRVKFMTNIPSDVLPAIYQQAEIFVYPSTYEGFGIPMLEALCSGIPAIGAKGSSLEEAGGPSSIYVNPEDEKELADAINKILTDESLKKSMIAGGYKYAEQFLPEQLAKNLSKVYLDVLNENTIPTKR